MTKKPATYIRSLVTLLVMGGQGISGVAVTTFFCNQKAALNEPFSITCRITGTIVTGIQWIRPGGTQVIDCTSATSCFSYVNGYTTSPTTSSENALNIANVGTSDGGIWTCRDGGTGSTADKGCEIVVQKNATVIGFTFIEKLYSAGDIMEVSVDVQNYYCSLKPSFHLLLDNQRVDLNALPNTPSTSLSGTQDISITVTEEMTGSIKLVFNCRDDDVLAEKTFNVSACDCSIIVTIIMIIIIVIKVLAFIILLIAISCYKEHLKVIQVLYSVDVILAVAAIIGGIVCIAVTVTEMTTCEGPICITNLCLSIIALVMALVNLLIIIFFLGSIMDNAGVNNHHLACHICAFPGSPTNATNSENSRGNDSQGTVPPKSKTTDGSKVSSL